MYIADKPESEMKSKAEVKAKLYYLSCLDANETIESLGAKPMLDLLRDIGGWNISGNFSESTWSLQRTLHTLHNRYNMGGLFVWAVNEDDKNSSRHVIQVNIPWFHIIINLIVG
jgi:membrane metallo-endopeptidase-like protein 1